MNDKPRPDVPHIAAYLEAGYCPAPFGPLADTRKITPGEQVLIDAQSIQRQPYWKLPRYHGDSRPSRKTFDHVLRDAVRRQSDVDVNYGVLLSGGVDSALVTALLRRLHPARKLPAYCIRFAETSFDEGNVAARVARAHDCPFIPVTVTAEDFPHYLRRLISASGELIADPAWIPFSKVVERASRDVPLLFSGEGADELFGGYPTYLGACWAPRYARLPGGIRNFARSWIKHLPINDKKVSLSFLLKRFMESRSQVGLERHLQWTASIPPAELRRLGIEIPATAGSEPTGALLDAVQAYDFSHSLPEALMAKADRGAMLHGVEVRSPYLDQRVIEFAFTLPARDRVCGFTTKPFLKRYARQYLSRAVVDRRKRGLSVPLSIWLRGPLREWATSCLAGYGLQRVGVDGNAAITLLHEHVERRRDHARAIWTLIVLSEWLAWLAAEQTGDDHLRTQ